MALRDFLFGFKFLATDYVSPVLKNIETRIEKVNDQVKNTARWREGAVNIGIMGGAFIAAGGAAVYALKSMADSAGAMQTVMTHVATAMDDGAATAVHLAQAQKMAEDTSIASGIAAVQEAQAYYTARSNALDHAQALAAVNVATKLVIGTTASLGEAQAQLDPTTRLLTGVYQTFGDKTKNAVTQMAAYGDQLSKLQTHYAFKNQDEINNALAYAVPLSKAAGIAFTDQNAALSLLSLGLKHGAEAGTAYQEVVSKLLAGGKLKTYTAITAQGGIDFGKTIARLNTATAGLTTAQRGAFLHQLGFTQRSIQGVSILIDKTDQYRSVVADLGNAQGANAAAFATRQASMEIATGRLSAAWDVLKSKIGENLLGPATYFTNELVKAVTWITALVEHHPQIAKFAVTFAAVGAAIAIVAGGAALVVAGLIAAASYASATVIAFAAIGTAIAGVTAWLYVWHSAALKTIVRFAGEAFSVGANIVKAIASGIWSAITLPQRAIEAVVSKISAFLPHSPAKEGPLRMLHRVRIVEELSRSIQPGPALTAMRRAAATLAIAAPVMLSPMMASPAAALMVRSPMMAAPALAGSTNGARAGGITIQVHQEIHIDGAIVGDERKLMATLRHHGEELAQIIDSRLSHRGRRSF